MEEVPVITNEIGFELAKKHPNLTENEAANYMVWCFHKRPPMKLVIFVDSNYQYGFTKFGDVIGAVCRGYIGNGDGVSFVGDNNVLYTGDRIGESMKFRVEVTEDFWIKKVQEKHQKFLDLCSTL